MHKKTDRIGPFFLFLVKNQGSVIPTGCLFFRLFTHHFSHNEMDENGGDHHGNGIGHQLCGNDAVKPEEAVEQEEKRNVHEALTANGKEQGFRSFSHGLKGEGRRDVIEHQRRCQAANPKERNTEGNGRRIPDEKADDGSGKELEE